MDTFRGDHTHCFLNEALVRGFSSLAEPGAAGEPVGQQGAYLAGFGVDVPGAQQLQDSVKVTVRVEGSQSSQHNGCVACLILLVSITQTWVGMWGKPLRQVITVKTNYSVCSSHVIHACIYTQYIYLG